MTTTPHAVRAPAWKIAAALALVYLAWGTTYFAIREGVKTLPPFLFGGSRITLAGVVLLLGLSLSGRSVRLSRRDLLWALLFSLVLFLGGNGLITIAEQTVASGLASVLIATTPLLMALLETLSPWGDRLTPRGWVGVLAGLVGVGFLALPKVSAFAGMDREMWGILMVLGSSSAWAVGSFLQRHWRIRASALVSAAYQMILGGGSMVLLGLLLGEGRQVGADSLTPTAIWAFCHLLIVGSLIGYVSYVWLLNHVSTTVAGTYAYVNPVVALLVGQLAGERNFTWPIVTGMLVIFAGVALVRRGGITPSRPSTSVYREGAARATKETTPARPPTCKAVEQC